MFCSDDLHPDDLLKGHLDLLVKKSLDKGHDILDILQYCCVNPVNHYSLQTGLLQPGDRADFIVVDSLENFRVLAQYAGGTMVAKEGKPLFDSTPPDAINNFQATALDLADLNIPQTGQTIQVIEVYDGDLITGKTSAQIVVSKDGFCHPDLQQDILKICVLNRYKPSKPALGFVTGFGLKNGAMASSIAHDSHNIIAIGCNDIDLLTAINEVIHCQGGISYARRGEVQSLALPVAGLMGQESCMETAKKHHEIEQKTKSNGCVLAAPFMTMSFLALPVIPHLKITDKGLFDVDSFSFISLFEDNRENR
jgi:adenine deaminase